MADVTAFHTKLATFRQEIPNAQQKVEGIYFTIAEGFLAWRNVTGVSPWRAKSRLAECFRSVAMAS